MFQTHTPDSRCPSLQRQLLQAPASGMSGCCLLSALAILVVFSGCSSSAPREKISKAGSSVATQPRILAESRIAISSSRSLSDPGLKAFLEANHLGGAWPRKTWDLDSLTLTALYYHPDIDAALASWEGTQAAKRTAGELPNPELELSPGYYSRVTSTASPPWIDGLNLNILFETAGKRGYRMAEAGHVSNAAKLSIASTAWQVRSRLRAALVEYSAAQKLAGLLKLQQQTQQENLSLLESQKQSGDLSAAVVARDRISFNNSLMAVHDADARVAVARIALAEAIGLTTAALDGVNISFDGLDAIPPVTDLAQARRLALFHRADVLSAVAQYAAADSAVKLATARQYPDIHLIPSYEYDQGQEKWKLGFSVELPVLNQHQGPVAEAKARCSEAEAKVNAAQSKALSEVERSLAAFQSARAKAVTANKLLSELEAQEKRLGGMLAAGGVSRQEFVSTQLELASSRVSRLEAAVQMQQALGQLEAATQSPMHWDAMLQDISKQKKHP